MVSQMGVRRMKIIRTFLLGAGFLALLSIAAAQQTTDPSQPDTASQIYLPAMNPNGPVPPIASAFNGITVNGNELQLNSVADVQTMLEALQAAPPTPLASLPKNRSGHVAFWSLQNPYWPPLPGDINGLDVWPLGNGCYILDDRNVDYGALDAAAALQLAAAPQTRMSMMMSSLSTAYAYGNPVYLTNMAASFAYDGSMTANFSIGGGTNFVPYDILMATNLLTPVSQWNWLGIGYTSNNYTFYEQPASLGFYILAKPSKTMTVGIGNDVVGQCDVPYGLTNALQMAGGGGQSLALKTDGTVVAWGQNYYGEGVVPSGLSGVAMVSAGYYLNVALSTNGTVTAWGISDSLLFGGFSVTNVPLNLTNAIVISAQALHTLALRTNGTVVAWGYNSSFGETNVPAGLTNVTAISAGFQFNLVVSNGYVVAWGDNTAGQCTVPSGLSNAVDVAAGTYHSLALRQNGTVVAWGDDLDGETDVPVGLSNVVAIAAGGDPDIDTAYSMALKKDGTLVVWGDDDAVDPFGGLNNVIGIAAGADHALAVRTGPRTPVITLEPVNQFLTAGGNATLTARGQGLYGVTYQWQFTNVNIAGATSTSLTLTNVQSTNQGNYRVIVTDNAGYGSIASSNAVLSLISPPVFTYQSTPTNIITIYGKFVGLSGIASAPGMTNGFPITYQWQWNGTNISGATPTNYSFTANDTNTGTYTLIANNAAGTASVSWSVALTNFIDVTQDLLLIYNTNSPDSTTVLNYYLAHRPNVTGANVLGINCTSNETIPPSDFTNSFVPQIQGWLAANPTKRPQYVVLFNQMPSRVNPIDTPGDDDETVILPSVQYQINSGICSPSWNPFVTSINMNGFGSISNCIGYIDKLEYFGTNYSPGKLVISGSTGGYANTNFGLDDVRHGVGTGDIDYAPYGYTVSNAIPIISAVSTNLGVIFVDGVENGTNQLPHLTNAVNVAGYISWGSHSSLGGQYAINGAIKWTGNSGWWLIKTLESFNGQWTPGQGNFVLWYSANAFGGTNYSNTPIGAASNTDEPGLESATTVSEYFELWGLGKNLAICAWNSRNTPNFQVVGDPFVTR
jgi:hypothetical protein